MGTPNTNEDNLWAKTLFQGTTVDVEQALKSLGEACYIKFRKLAENFQNEGRH